MKMNMKVILAIAEAILIGLLIDDIVRLTLDDPGGSLIKAVFMATACAIIFIPLIKGGGTSD